MMLKLTSPNGQPYYVVAEAIAAVYPATSGEGTYVALYDDAYSVRESAEEVVALIESPRQPADYAPIVDAARRLVEWQDSADVDLDAHEQIVEAARTALAALPAREVPRG